MVQAGGNMAKKTVIVNRFDGGMKNDLNTPDPTGCAKMIHFDPFTDVHRLIPHYSQEDGNTSVDSSLFYNFEFDGSKLFAYSAITTASHIHSVTDNADTTWTDEINLGATVDAAQWPLFVYYRQTDSIYGVYGSQYVWSYDVGADTANNTEQDLTSWANVSNGIIHSKDDVLYFGYDNKIAKNDNGSWTTPAFTLPTDYVITYVCEYGDNLAIAARHKGTNNSKVYLWNRDESTPFASKSIDWGKGALMVLEELEGGLVGISFQGVTNWDGSATFDSAGKSRTIFRKYLGYGDSATKINEFIGFGQTPTIQGASYAFKTNQRIYFPAVINIEGTVANQVAGEKGIWSISKNSRGEFVVAKEFSYLNETPDNGLVHGLIVIGNFLYASYLDNSTHYTDKTNDGITFTQTSVYESIINPGMSEKDRFKLKDFESIAVFCEKLQSGEQVVAKIKVDGGSFSSAIITKTSSSPDADVIGFELAPGVNNVSGRDFEFRLESTGGAIIKGYAYKYSTRKGQTLPQ